MAAPRRVVVTGFGVVSALGLDRESHVDALRQGRCGVGELTIEDAERLSVRIGAAATGFVGEDRFTKSDLALCDRTT